jgi:hypothetical protein
MAQDPEAIVQDEEQARLEVCGAPRAAFGRMVRHAGWPAMGGPPHRLAEEGGGPWPILRRA